MRILLVNPPFFRFIGVEQDYPPLSLLSVGAFLESQGNEVYIKNFEIDPTLANQCYNERRSNFDNYLHALDNDSHPIWEEYINTIKNIKPDKIGITVVSVKYKISLMLCNIAHDMGIEVFVGGPHATISPNSFPEYVEVYTGEFESENGKRCDPNKLPYFNYNQLLDKYGSEGLGHIISSRGCPFYCRFCASSTIWNRKVTYKSVDRIINEMEIIYNKFKPEYFTIWDETFTLSKKRTFEFCSKYKLPAKWRCDTRADALTEEMLIAMSNAGCDQIGIGIESGNQRILDYIKKGEKKEEFIRVSKLLKEYNFQWKGYCIIGFPEETENDIFETIDFFKSLGPSRITLSFFTPYLGTSLYDECLEKNIIDSNFDPSYFSYYSSHNYFCPKITKERYYEIQDIISKDIDEYNKEGLKLWK